MSTPAIHVLDLHFYHEHTIASFLIDSGDGWVLVETGPHSVFAQLQKGLAAHGLTPSDISDVLLTHIHFDHAGAAWALAKAGARIHVHPVGLPHMASPERLYSSAARIYGDKMEELWGQMHPIAEDKLNAIEHGDVVKAGSLEFVGHHTPGHASHHIAWQLGDIVFTGDVAGCRIELGPVVPPCPPPDINIEAWKDSIALIKGLEPELLYLTHFGPVRDIEAHFNQLEHMLDDWASWIKVHMEQGLDAAAMTPRFQAYAREQLLALGATEHMAEQYEAANPAWMSVAGLIRYWKKKEG
jgi:glyoxylase-like metal-dependent hydrolase (beta-lactamase superfamily II)